jgi:hypothetical protein
MYKSSVTTFFYQKREDPLSRACENFKRAEELSNDCHKVIIDAPKNQNFVNFFLNSDIDNITVEIVPTEMEWVNYAGFFSGCRKLNARPEWDNSKNKSMAAMFKSCDNMRFSLHNIDTSNVIDFRQCFWGALNYSGNGIQSWDFSSARSPDAFNNFFGGGSSIQTIYYDELIESLYKQMKAGTLPTPMKSVNMGDSYYSPYMKEKHDELVAYGWDIVDGGVVPYELSPMEKYFSKTVDSRLAANNFPGDIDFGPVCVGSRNGILITPRHTLHVRHYMPSVGQSMKLISGEEVVVDKVDSGWMGLDIGIATLREGAKTKPALVLPSNWQELMPLLNGPPTHYPKGVAPALIRFKRGGVPTVNDATYAKGSGTPNTGCRIPVNQLRLDHFDGIKVGDSGSAVCFVYDNRLVVSYSLATSDGSGVFLAGCREWTDAILARTGHSFEECPPRPPIIPL